MREKKRVPRYRYTDRSVLMLAELLNRKNSRIKNEILPDVTEAEAIMRLIEENLEVNADGYASPVDLKMPDELRETLVNRLDNLLKVEKDPEEDLLLYMKNMHRSLWSGILDDAGLLREDKAAWSVPKKADYATPSPKKLEDHIVALLEWLRSDRVPSLVRAAVAGYAITILQPFASGNEAISLLFARMVFQQLCPAFRNVELGKILYYEKNMWMMGFALSLREENAIHGIEAFLEILQDSTEEIDADAPETAAAPAKKRSSRKKSGNTERKTAPRSTEGSEEKIARLVAVLGDAEMSTREMMEALQMKHRPTFRDSYLLPAMEKGYVEMTNPDKPNSSRQKYRLKKNAE